MIKRTISFLLITSLLAQTNYGFAQSLNANQEQEDLLRKNKCFSDMTIAGAMSPSDYNDLQNLTASMMGPGAEDSDEVKELYIKNNCNPDAVKASKNTAGKNNPFDTEEDQSFSFGVKKPKNDEFDQACEMEEALTDGEGCQPVRVLHQAIKSGKFTAKEYHAAKNSKSYQYSNLAAAVGIAVGVTTLAISSYQAYLARESYELQKKQYEDSKKATQQASQPCTVNNQPQKSPEAKSEPKQTPKQDPAPETKPIQQTSAETQNPTPDIKDPEHPAADWDPETDAEWINFSSDVQKQNQLCDQKKQARNKGVSLFEIQNQQVIHSVSTENSVKGCNVSNLKRDLLILKGQSDNCFDSNIECIKKQNAKTEKKEQEIKKLKDAYHKCEMSMGGSSADEKKECNEIQKKMQTASGIKPAKGIKSLDDFLSDVKSSMNPKPSPTPALVGGL